ncbi:MAG: PLP-dependent aminotransferase family protein [Jatrophihabitantaceae bacterium]
MVARTTTGPALAARAGGLVGSVIDSSTSLLQKQTHDIVRFAMGSPAAEAVPTRLLAEIGADELGPTSADAFDYAATEGDPPLRNAVLEMLSGTGEATAGERLTITSGGMQGIDLACKLYVDPGDLAIVESPTYTNGSATILSYGGVVMEAPVDADGMIVEQLPELVARSGRIPRAIYTIPNFQNPSGTTMSLPRRQMLLDLARGWAAVIIDDDPYGPLRFEGDELPSLRELGQGESTVFSVRTFSKILAPGLRVGYVDAAPELADLLINAKQAMDTCTNLPAQRLVARFLADGHLRPHVSGLRLEYLRRKRAMQASLTEHFGDIATWTDPHGGFFLWVAFADASIDTQRLFEVALAEGVAFIPGNAFSPGARFGNALRLCFASTTPERTAVGIARLRAAFDRLAGADR